MAEPTNDQTSQAATPEDLSTLSEKDLAALEKSLAKDFDKINSKESVSAEDLQEMTRLADAIESVRAEGTSRQAEAQERQQARADLAARIAPVAEAEGDESDVEVPNDVSSLTVDEAVPSAVGSEDEEDEAKADAPEPVLVASKRAPVRATPRVAPRTVTPEQTRVDMDDAGLSIVAASDIPGTPTGQRLDHAGLADALHRRARGMSDSKNQALVASISLENPKNDASNVNDDTSLRDFWADVTNPEALTASGGWCAPSETLYDFTCDFETVDGILNLPTVTTSRGGIRYPVNPLLRDVFAGYPDNGSGFEWTEADDIAAATPGGPTKPCFTIPCPTFEETRLQAQGICVTAGNLTDRAYPELTRRYVDLVMSAHAHRMNGLTIAKVVAESTAVNLAPQFGAASALLSGLELQISYLRDSYFMSEDARLEVVLPRWVRAVVRHDLARRNGVAFDLVTNAQIAAWFDAIGASVQFVSDWQSLIGGAPAAGAPASSRTAPTTWPDTVDMLVYPAGTHSRMTGGSIDLGVVRDSTLNSTNDYTAAWTEEFWNVVTRGCVSLVVTIAICPDGTTGGQEIVTCPTV